jgi:hypothetical protein
LLLTVLDYQKELQKVVVTAFAEALAAAESLKKADGCLAWANAGGCIYVPKNPNTKRPNCGGQTNLAEFKCTAAAVSVGAIEEIDAVADASALPPPPALKKKKKSKGTCFAQCFCSKAHKMHQGMLVRTLRVSYPAQPAACSRCIGYMT